MIKNGLMALVAGAALAVAGCGGGSDNKTLSYSDFGKKADAVCTQVNAKTDPIGSKLTGKADNDAQYYSQLIPAVEQGRKDFADLKPPDELKSYYDTFLSVTDQQIAAAKKAEAAAKAGDQAGYITALQSAKPLQAQSNAAASKLGSAVCAK